jgi:hypothetical protein
LALAVPLERQRQQLVATDQTLYFRLLHQLVAAAAVDIQQLLLPDKMVALVAVLVGERNLAEQEHLVKETMAALLVEVTLAVEAVERDRLVLLQRLQILEVMVELGWYLLLLVAECFMLAVAVEDQIAARLD